MILYLRYKLTFSLFLLAMCTLAVADPSAETSQADLKAKLGELAQAEKECEEIRAKAYRDNPSLAYAHELFQEAERRRPSDGEAREYRKRIGHKQYLKLKMYYSESREFQKALKALDDPKLRPILLWFIGVMAKDRMGLEFRENGPVAEGVYTLSDHLDLLKKLEAENKAKLEQLQTETDFPDCFFEYLSLQDEVSSMRMLSDSYIRGNTPEVLKAAEKRVRHLKIALSNAHPGWHERSLQMQEEAQVAQHAYERQSTAKPRFLKNPMGEALSVLHFALFVGISVIMWRGLLRLGKSRHCSPDTSSADPEGDAKTER